MALPRTRAFFDQVCFIAAMLTFFLILFRPLAISWKGFACLTYRQFPVALVDANKDLGFAFPYLSLLQVFQETAGSAGNVGTES